MPNMVQTMFIASASSIQSSDTYMTIETPMFSSPTPNLNGVRVTAGFIDEIVSNQDKYIGLPLVADVANLEARKFDRLGHRYDRRNDTYGTQIIGAFYKFEKEERDDETVLVGYARVMKRNKGVCAAINELYAQGGLKFSFEISCGTYTKLADGTIEIDADAHNCWESMCVVSSPAYPDAIAYQLVAETDPVGKEEAEPMKEKEIKDAEVQAEETLVTENNVFVPAETQAEETPVTTEVETAETYVTEVHKEKNAVHTYDPETGEETHTEIQIEQSVSHVEAEEAEAAANAVAIAETEEKPDEEEDLEEKPDEDEEEVQAEEQVNAEGEDTPAEEPAEDGATDEDTAAGENGVGATADDGGKRNAEYEAFIAEINKLVDAIKAENEALKQEIAELKESMTTKIVAETESAVNPFMADMSIKENEDHYRLLKEDSYSGDYHRLLG